MSRRLPAAPDEDELSIRLSPCRRHQWSLTVLFACYININYSTERSADKQPGLFYLICKNISLAFILYFFFSFFLSLYLFYHIFRQRVIRMYGELKSSPRLFWFEQVFWSQHLIFLDWICCFVPIFNILKLYLLLPKHFRQLQVFSVSPSYSWRCGKSHTH